MAKQSDPYLDEGMHGYIRRTAMKDFWRVSAWYDDVADLIQDGYLCYAMCRRRYVVELGTLPAVRPTQEHRRWMMSLVKTTFDRYIRHTVAARLRDGHEVPVSQLVHDGASEAADPWESIVSAAGQAGEVSLLDVVWSLPAEVQELMVVLASGGAEALRVKRLRLSARETSSDAPPRVSCYRRSVRETTNQYYCRLVGLDPSDHDLAGQVRDAVRL